jgi:small multidrug resistance family-3 protein
LVEIILSTLGLFLLAAVLEISGGYLIWKWLKNHKGAIFGLLGSLILFTYAIIPTFQPTDFGRVYATYGGFFIIVSILWGYWIDKKKPDRFEIIGSIIVLVGVIVMFYFPR